jgi:hypothetical protein
LRLSKPEKCPNEIWNITITCWNLNPSQRPTFGELCRKLPNDSANIHYETIAIAEEKEDNYNNFK